MLLTHQFFYAGYSRSAESRHMRCFLYNSLLGVPAESARKSRRRAPIRAVLHPEPIRVPQKGRVAPPGRSKGGRQHPANRNFRSHCRWCCCIFSRSVISSPGSPAAPSRADRLEDFGTRLLVKAAQLYHFQGLNQDQIGRQVGVSRSKVSRMLKEARGRSLSQPVGWPTPTARLVAVKGDESWCADSLKS